MRNVERGRRKIARYYTSKKVADVATGVKYETFFCAIGSERDEILKSEFRASGFPFIRGKDALRRF